MPSVIWKHLKEGTFNPREIQRRSTLFTLLVFNFPFGVFIFFITECILLISMSVVSDNGVKLCPFSLLAALYQLYWQCHIYCDKSFNSTQYQSHKSDHIYFQYFAKQLYYSQCAKVRHNYFLVSLWLCKVQHRRCNLNIMMMIMRDY